MSRARVLIWGIVLTSLAFLLGWRSARIGTLLEAPVPRLVGEPRPDLVYYVDGDPDVLTRKLIAEYPGADVISSDYTNGYASGVQVRQWQIDIRVINSKPKEVQVTVSKTADDDGPWLNRYCSAVRRFFGFG
jgi:hypothetical protein